MAGGATPPRAGTAGPLGGVLTLSTSARRALSVLAALSVGQAVAIVAMAEALASAIAALADGRTTGLTPWLTLLTGAVLLRAALAWAVEVVAVRASASTKAQLRRAALEPAGRSAAVCGGDRDPAGSVAVLLTSGLDELDRWFGAYLPALTTAAVLPALVGLRLLLADWLTALIVAVTVPLVPVFMVLIGRFTQERSAAALRVLMRLGAQIAELARGLPVLIGLGRAADAADALAETSEAHRRRTMHTLRLAFGSALALELIATLSVAVVAVVIGIRLLHGGMDLRTGLLLLILAPECYLPLRAVGAAYHASAAGMAALRRVAGLLATPQVRPLPSGPAGEIAVRELSVHWPDRQRATPATLSMRVPARGFVAIAGESGCGKSTVLAVLSGQLGNEQTGDGSARHGPRVSGSVSGVDLERIAYVPQHPRCTEDTVLAEVLLAGASLSSEVDASLAREALAEVELLALADREPADLSAGELHRLAMARALLRVRLGAGLLLLDEPSAHLDAGTEDTVAEVLRTLRGRVSIVLVSHRETMLGLADEVIGIAGGAATPARTDDPASTSEDAADTVDRPATPAERTPHRNGPGLLRVLRPGAPRLLLAVLLGTLSMVSGIALTATSAWLIARAAEQPPMLTLMVAIVGVRAFGLGRATLRYAERLVGHDAVLRLIAALRLRLWHGLARSGGRAPGGGTALGRLVSDVDSVGDVLLRAVLPVFAAATTATTVAAGMALLLPGYGLLLTAVLLASLLLVPVLARWADRRASTAQAVYRRRLLGRVCALLDAGGQARVHGVHRALGAQVSELDDALASTAHRGAWAAGLAGAVVHLLCGLAATAGLLLAAAGIAAGALDPLLAGVLALVPLGMVEVLTPLGPAAQQLPLLRHPLHRLREITPPAEPVRTGSLPERISTLRLRGVTAHWPEQPGPVFAPVDVRLCRGDWLAVTGASGAGKSTLLATLLGFLRPSSGEYLLSEVDTSTVPAAELTGRISWCPQEATLFSSTLRGNLALAGRHQDDAELRAVLRTVGLGGLLDDLPDGLDTRIGEGGAALPGGGRQRLAVARALLRRSEVVLLDEPTAHLDPAGARALLADLTEALAGRIVVLVTHDEAQARGCRHRIRLAKETAMSPH